MDTAADEIDSCLCFTEILLNAGHITVYAFGIILYIKDSIKHFPVNLNQ